MPWIPTVLGSLLCTAVLRTRSQDPDNKPYLPTNIIQQQQQRRWGHALYSRLSERVVLSTYFSQLPHRAAHTPQDCGSVAGDSSLEAPPWLATERVVSQTSHYYVQEQCYKIPEHTMPPRPPNVPSAEEWKHGISNFPNQKALSQLIADTRLNVCWMRKARQGLESVLLSCGGGFVSTVFSAAASGRVVDWVPVVTVFSHHLFFQRCLPHRFSNWIRDRRGTLSVSTLPAPAVYNSGLLLFRAVLECLQVHLSRMQMLKLVMTSLEGNYTGHTALSQAVFSRDSDLFQAVLQCLREVVHDEQMVETMTVIPNRNGRDVVSEIMIRQEHLMLKEVLGSGAQDRLHEQVREILTSRDKDSNSVLLRAAASGHASVWQTVMKALHERLPENVHELLTDENDGGDTVLVKAVESGGSKLFNVVLNCLRGLFDIEQVRDLILSRGKEGTTVLVAAFKLQDAVSLEAVLDCLKEAGPPKDKQVAEMLGAAATFSACVEVSLHLDADSRRAATNVLSFLLASYARPSPDDLMKLSRKARQASDDHFNTCCLKAVASATNPFIPGMTLSVMLAKAAEKAPEGERKGLLSVQANVVALLLEILERLPQTVRAFDGGMEYCASVLEPDLVGSVDAPTGTEGPLSLVLRERQQREVFCKNPLVTDFLSRRFTRGLPDLWDSDGVLNDKEQLLDLEGRGADGVKNGLVLPLWGESLDGNYATLPNLMAHGGADTDGRNEEFRFEHEAFFGRHSLLHCLKSPRTLLQGANARFPSLSFLPGAQFIAAGLAANHSSYYSVPSMRMVLDFIVYLSMLAVFSDVVLFYEDGTLTWEEGIFAAYIVAGGIRELREIKRDVGTYFEDRWNVFDVLGLMILTAGLIVRGVDSSSQWGRALYALSAPLFFSRILFFAQILRFQGPMIEVIFSMTEELVKFGIVMVVVMVGFAMSFHALLRDSDSFGETLLNLFKAMLGEVGFFDEFSGGPDDVVATILLVVYLVIIAIMLLNLLIAILSTSHAKVQENAEREFKISKALMIKHYRLVVKEDLLPAPFNLVQLFLSLPFMLLDCMYEGGSYGRAKHATGRVVFWFVLGSASVIGGTLLWTASVMHSASVWRKHYSEHRNVLKRNAIASNNRNLEARLNEQDALWPWAIFMLKAHLVMFTWCLVIAPLTLLALWLGLPFLVNLLQQWLTHPVSEYRGGPPSSPPTSLGLRKHGRGKYGTKGDTPTVEGMLKRAPGGVGADDLCRYLNDPIIDDDVREDEKIRGTTVEHMKLLRNRLEHMIDDVFEKVLENTTAADKRLTQLENVCTETQQGRVEIDRKLEELLTLMQK